MRENTTAIATDQPHRAGTIHTGNTDGEAVDGCATPAAPSQGLLPDRVTANGAPPHRPAGDTAGREEADPTGQHRPAGSLLAPIDLTKVLVAGELAVAATVIAVRLFDRIDGLRTGPRAHIHMGPGGWVSMRGGAAEIHARQATPSPGSRAVWHRSSACRRAPSRVAQGSRHEHRTGDHRPRCERKGQQVITGRTDRAHRPWWAVLLGAKPVDRG